MPRDNRCQEGIDAQREKMPRDKRCQEGIDAKREKNTQRDHCRAHHMSAHHMTSHCITWHDTTQAITSHQMTWPPHQVTWHASKQVTSPPWNSKRLVHSKEMVWASRWSVALRTFYRQILSLLHSSFFFWNFRPRLARELLVNLCNFAIEIYIYSTSCTSITTLLTTLFLKSNQAGTAIHRAHARRVSLQSSFI